MGWHVFSNRIIMDVFTDAYRLLAWVAYKVTVVIGDNDSNGGCSCHTGWATRTNI